MEKVVLWLFGTTCILLSAAVPIATEYVSVTVPWLASVPRTDGVMRTNGCLTATSLMLIVWLTAAGIAAIVRSYRKP